MSYKVYVGTQTDVDVWSQKTCIYDPSADDNTKILLDPTLTREGGKAGSFEATIPLGNVAHSALQKLKTVIEVEQDGETLWQGRVMRHEMDFLLRQKIFCEGELAYLNDSSKPPYEYHNITLAEFLDEILSFHNEQVEPYKSFHVGRVAVGETGIQLLCATGCTVQDDKERNDEGGYDHNYNFYDQNGILLCGNGSSNPASWDANSVHIVTGTLYDSNGVYSVEVTVSYVISKGTDDYTVLLPWCVDSEKAAVYRTDTSTVNSSKSVSSGTRVVHTATEKVSPSYQIVESDDGSLVIQQKITERESTYPYTVTEKWVDATGYELQTEYPLHDFGDGKNFGITWDVLKSELTDVYGGYFLIRRKKYTSPITGTVVKTFRFLDYLSEDNITEKNTQAIEFGENMLDLDSYTRAENIVTRVIAVGYKTKGWWIWKSTSTIQAVADDTAAQKVYGIIQRVIVVEGTASTVASLKKAAEQELKKNLRMVDGFTINALDLKDAGLDVDRIQPMRKTHVLAKPHGLDGWLLCTKIVEPLAQPDKKQFTIGTSFSSISDLQALSSARASVAFDLALSAGRSLRQ